MLDSETGRTGYGGAGGTMMRRRGWIGAGTALAAALLACPLAQAMTPPALRQAVRQDLLSRINRDRQAHGVGPVILELPFSAVADRRCEQQIREGTVGHFGIDGMAPYARYSLAGSNDGTAENAVSWSANYRFSAPAVLDLGRRSHEAMMAEKPPGDSHRKVILDPHATHVAIGLAWKGGELRLVQIFFRRHIDWHASPRRNARPGDLLYASGRPLDGWRITSATLHHEQIPQTLSPTVANRIETYALPPQKREFRARGSALEPGPEKTLSRWAATRRNDAGLTVANDGSFSFAAPLSEGPGIYTLVVWVGKGRGAPAVAASHISTIVRESAPGAGIAVQLGR